MNERFAVVFEVYRYAVCWLAVALFMLFSFLLMLGFFSPIAAQNLLLLSAQGGGLLLCLAVFVLHWRMKNPHAQAGTTPTPVNQGISGAYEV